MVDSLEEQTLTDDQQQLLDELVDAFENHGAALRVVELDDRRADALALIAAGFAEARPPGRLDAATWVVPSAKARRPMTG